MCGCIVLLELIHLNRQCQHGAQLKINLAYFESTRIAYVDWRLLLELGISHFLLTTTG